jgi:hypothetical protein
LLGSRLLIFFPRATRVKESISLLLPAGEAPKPEAVSPVSDHARQVHFMVKKVRLETKKRE